MIDVKEAVKTARNYAVELYGSDKLPQLELEEVELSDDERSWFVTLGFDTPEVNPLYSSIAGLVRTPKLRKYKIFRINATTGTVTSMKIRDPLQHEAT